MLGSETKQKIQNLRDTLVGKIPVPTEQVKQITLGLIYKFMSDIDQENKELDGKSFFRGDYEKYSWYRIIDRGLSSYDRVLLYSEGLEKMALNPNIPQLFRDIFKGAFLPFRDPAIVNEFLKGINEFKYEHSEDLGDAFEFLLMVMDAQGDAGQFRTPRHIIDFIVQAVDPQKTDKILDPACGTAGFLVGAYKNILKQNTAPNSNRSGSALTTTQRNNLSKNFVGYDISHDMVRLSLVNMYLHQFSDPKIYEYDTLTSLDRWEDNFDCILANPPFMTPRGGIRPHNRFAIRANRSEVLFVDYITEHLNPSGKAGIIVPEGIIFQSSNAYKALRKMLVENNYLYAVVSLPAGIFQPYSGVKTSILLIDKTLAKKTKDILFVKIDSDGFDLGAQRRPVEKNDLPKALEVITKYKQALIEEGKANFLNKYKDFAQIVKKQKIAECGDYYLSAERYKEGIALVNNVWPLVEIREICKFTGGYAFKSSELLDEQGKNTLPVVKIGNLINGGELSLSDVQYYNYSKSLDKYLIRKGDILIAMTGATVGKVAVSHLNEILLNQRVGLVRILTDKVKQGYLKYLLLSKTFYEYCQNTAGGGAQGNISPTQILKYKIPLPPLNVQQEIVAELDCYQKIIDGARQVVENYKPQIKIDPEWAIANLGEVAEVISGQSPEGKFYNQDGQGLPFYQGKTEFEDIYIGIPNNWTTQITKIAEKDDILMSVRAPVGPVNLAAQKICIGRGLAAIRPNQKVELTYLFNYLKSIQDTIKGNGGAVFDSISREQIQKIKIPLPSPEIQKQIVVQIEEEQKLVEANKKLIEVFEQKIKDKIREIWGV